MPLDALLADPVVGVNPQDRLPITAQLWRDAHGQHSRHRMLHMLSAHRPGIVYGLDVVVSSKNPRKVWVTPGVAVDAEGNVIVLSASESFEFTDRGMNYLVIAYDEGDVRESLIDIGNGEQVYANFVEFRRILVTKEAPTGTTLELARVERGAADAPVSEPANPFDPGRNELNQLYRRLSFPYCRVDGEIGEVSHVPKADMAGWKPNRAGLVNLVRAANNMGFHLDFVGPYRLTGNDATPPLVLYFSGKEAFNDLSEEELGGLRSYLRRGGLLFGDASKGDKGFVKSFTSLAETLGAKLAPMKKDHPLLASNHRFAAAPIGGQEAGEILIDDAAGIMLSTFDYGGAWQGGAEDTKTMTSRERIRQAEEFGLNVVAHAAARFRQAEMERLKTS